MAKMRIAYEDRPRVKLECLRALRQLRLTGPERSLISEFVDTYLDLEPLEKEILDTLCGALELEEQEGVAEMVTSWKREGIEEGRQRMASMVVRLLKRRFGALPESTVEQIQKLQIEQIENLSDALFDLSCLDELLKWLSKQQER